MSQMLRLVTVGTKFINVYTKQTSKCHLCGVSTYQHASMTGVKLLSTAQKSLSPKRVKSNTGKKKSKYRKPSEDVRKMHMKELMSTFQSITEKCKADGAYNKETVKALLENSWVREETKSEHANKLPSSGYHHQTNHTKDAMKDKDAGVLEQDALIPSDVVGERGEADNIAVDSTNLARTKSSFDIKKPFVNKTITSSVPADHLPEVHKLDGDTVTTKKRRLSKKSKNNLLKRLFATHPYIEHMQGPNSNSPTPEMVKELAKLLEDGNLSADLRKDLTVYLQNTTSHLRKQAVGQQRNRKLKKSVESKEPLWVPDDLDSSERIKEITSQVVKLFSLELNKQAKQRALEQDAQKRVDTYHREVAAYVDACILTGMLKRAQVLLIGPSENKKKRGRRKTHKKITDVNIFNTLVHAWAKTGKIDPVRELFQYMETEGISPTLQSYAGVLECLGRQRTPPTDIIEKVIEDIQSMGHNVEEICLSCDLRENEWSCIRKVLDLVRPEVKPTLFIPPDVNYQCDLLNDLPQIPQKNPFTGVLSEEDLSRKAQEQLALELEDKVIVKSIVPEVKVTPQIQQARNRLTKTRERWRHVLRHGFLREVEKLESKAKDDFTTSNMLPYMRIFPADSFVDLMLQQIDGISQEMESFSPPLTYIHSTLGFRVYHRIQLLLKQKHKQVAKISDLYDKYLKLYNTETTDSNLRQTWQRLQTENADGSTLVYPVHRWPNYVAKSVGRFLMNIIMNEVKVDSNAFKPTKEKSEVPAFYSVSRSRNNVPQEEIMPHPVLVRLHKEAHTRDLIFLPHDMPSLVPPIPWTSVNMGGNILCTTDLIKNAAPDFTVHRDATAQQLYPVFDALNGVSAVPWKINQTVLDTIIEVFNSGGNPAIDIPEPTSKCPPLPKFSPDMTPEERMAVIFERNKMNKNKKEMFSLWCTEQYRLSIANKHRDEIFWFPHNLDFRSRFYAVPPHFNHLGSDVARSMLLFAKGKPLGTDGLMWLKIHLINLTGFKKRSANRERLQYADSLMAEILDSADKPLTGRKWWQSSDEPWQTLACCMEIAKAIRSPDHQRYVCYYPVHQDGSCNGLQHYAALGRDQAGAESVNLRPFDSPKDVYSDIVEMVEREREVDAARGTEVALVLEGFVRRKVIKQTIMTTVYGVTKFGARQQIRGQLDDISEFQQKFAFDGMFYLTDKTFSCLQQMFTSTKEIQDWFVICAELISRICYKPVEWVTPVGWPVLQPYYRHTRIHRPDKPDKYINIEKPNATKQKNAFPPNFIHSLDSTHMMLTSIHCMRHGVNFVAVHDCFWTHPADVDVMNKICREQFVALHKQPILEDLAVSLLEKYGFPERECGDRTKRVTDAKRYVNTILGKLPTRGVFNIDEVLNSTYFFS